MLSRREKRQCRLGTGEVIEVLPHRAQPAIVLLSENGCVRADKLDKPRGFFMVTPDAQPDGRLRLEFVPGIDHGELGKHYVSSQGGVRVDVRREQQLYNVLAFQSPVNPDQTIVITSTPEPKGIGATFFANRFESSAEQLMLLIRVARAQRDDLFLPSEQPLVTPLE